MTKRERAYTGGQIALAMCAMYMLCGGMQFVAGGFFAVYIGSHTFLDNTSIGYCVALSALVTTIAQPLWGVLADHSESKNRILRIMLISIAALVWLFILPRYENILTLLVAVVAVFSTVFVPMALTDTIVVENIDKARLRYGIIRAFASGGAASAAFALFILNRVNPDVKPQYAFILLSGTALLALIPLRFIPLTRGHAAGANAAGSGAVSGTGYSANANAGANAVSGTGSNAGSGAVSGTGYSANANAGSSAVSGTGSNADSGAVSGSFNFRGIFANKRLMLLLSFGLLQFIFVSCHHTYFSVYYATDRGINAGIGMFSLFFAVSIAAEAVVMVFGYKFFSRLNVYTIFSIVPVAACMRSLIVYLSSNPYVMMICAVFHGLLFGLLWLRVAPYIGSIVSDEMRATGQACWSVMLMGLGPVLGSALGGFLTKYIELRNVFLITSCSLMAVSAIFIILFRRQRAADAAEGFKSV